jgi:hypothetical protein
MDGIVASTNISNAVEDDKQASSWIAIPHSHSLSILKFISDASPDALERLLLCFGCLESEIFQNVQGGSKLVGSKCFHWHTGYGTSEKFRCEYTQSLSQSFALANVSSN